MIPIAQRLEALEQCNNPSGQLPFVVLDTCSDEELERLQRNGRKVFRFSDPKLFDEFI